MEIEAKFVLADRKVMARLRRARELAGFALAKPNEQRYHDQFLDTAGLKLKAAGWYLRLREAADGRWLTLKGQAALEGDVHRRQEWNIPLPEGTDPANAPAGELHDRLTDMLGGEPLVPLVSLDQVRWFRTLSRDGRAVAELSLDEVHYQSGQAHATDLELEVELGQDGTPEDLLRVTTCLRDTWHLTPQSQSKFERALALVQQQASSRLLSAEERATLERIAQRGGNFGKRARALLAVDEGASLHMASARAPMARSRIRYWLRLFPEKHLDVFPAHVLRGALEKQTTVKPATAPPATPSPQPGIKVPDKPGLTQDDTMAEAARKTFRFHLLTMLAHEPGTRQGKDPEELHDMRVATRRMRTAGRVFDGYVDSKAVKPYYKALRRAGRTLGAVRDLDVFREKVQPYLDSLPPERAHELDPLLAAWQARRDEARAELLTFLDSDKYRRFAQEFSTCVETPWEPRSGPGALPLRLRHAVPVVIEQRLSTVLALAEAVAAPETPLTRYHQLRIASKELRYALEFFTEVLGGEARELIKTVKQVQDHLGNLQDAVVASGVLRDFLTWGTWGKGKAPPAAPVIAPGVAAYLAVRQTEIQELVTGFAPLRLTLVGPDPRRLASAAMARLWEKP